MTFEDWLKYTRADLRRHYYPEGKTFLGTVAPFGDDPSPQLNVKGINGGEQFAVALKIAQTGTRVERIGQMQDLRPVQDTVLWRGETIDELRQRVRHSPELRGDPANTGELVYLVSGQEC